MSEFADLVLNINGQQVRTTLTIRDGQPIITDYGPVAKPKPRVARTPCKGCGKETPSLAKRMASGAIGITKSIIGVDRADGVLVDARWAECSGCPANRQGVCDDCGCILPLKVRIQSERCPRGLW